MIGIKRRSSVYYPIKEYYKRRLMVGDMLTNKTLYADFPDDFANKTDLNLNESERAFCIYNNSSPGSYDVRLLEYTDGAFEYGICVGPTALRNNIYFYNIETNKLEVNKNEYKMSDKVQDVTEVTDCQAYRHIYIKDPNIRPLKVGDALKNGTKLYFNIPDNITKLYSEYKYTSSTRSKVRSKTPILKATPSSESTTDTLINKFLKVTYYPDGTVRRASVTNLILTDGSSNIDIFKATYNQSNFYKPEINISTYTVTNTIVISNYNEFDFWSQFILVDETTL
jgi:hypothetical protein|nr:MAG TPA: hypothetical protein [Caudoviricetes sp.]